VKQEAYNNLLVLLNNVTTEQVKEELIESPIKSDLVKEEANIVTLQNIKSETVKGEPKAVAIKIKIEED
jgi:hypothetical protein